MIELAASAPWQALPTDIAAGLARHLSSVVDETIATIAREVPAYARPLEGAFGVGLRQGVEVALGRFLTLPGSDEPALTETDREVYVRLGRGEMRAGRALEALLQAYRIGARVAFRRFATHAREDGLPADGVVPLAEAVFAYIDELSAASAEGYAAEQSARADEQGRRRRELLELLLATTVDATAVAEAAPAVGWVPPEQAMAVLVPLDAADTVRTRLGTDALVAERGDTVVGVVPTPLDDRSRNLLSRRLRSCAAVIGPSRQTTAVATSLRLAGAAVRLQAAGVIDADPLFVDEHLATLVVHNEPELLDDLTTRRLAPLGSVRASSRDRLAETLLAWLQHHGQRQHVAEALHVHPQTVSYRLTQLRELFGAQLDDPAARFELEIALRATSRRS
ncbi:MAG: helix-turn-helix domain-containing protein [Actinobacteria bacterium]|nr:helix-turn-helix domain-containing protein [Actinomycetota bacterium]